jgi:hypothetical protein
MTRLDEIVRLSPPGEPAGATVPPWDLTRFAPSGNGIAMGIVVLPYGAMPQRSPGYALYEHVWEPFLGAPPSEPSGGVLYFNEFVARADLEATLRLLGVRLLDTGYLAYAERATDVARQRFATQLRLVTYSSLGLFGFPRMELALQPVPIGEALWRFVQLHRDEPSDAIRGSLGGDGDWADERFAFGFLVENAYNGVYRIWSRPYLSTK